MKATLQPVLLIAVLFCFVSSSAQDKVINPATDTSKVKKVLVQASFPGGDAAWREFLESTLRSDVPIKKNAPAGRYDVILSFLVDKTGKVGEVKVEKDPGFGTSEEAIRVFKKSPRWTPATVDGAPVIYRQRQMISFQVTEEEPKKKKRS